MQKLNLFTKWGTFIIAFLIIGFIFLLIDYLKQIEDVVATDIRLKDFSKFDSIPVFKEVKYLSIFITDGSKVNKNQVLCIKGKGIDLKLYKKSKYIIEALKDENLNLDDKIMGLKNLSKLDSLYENYRIFKIPPSNVGLYLKRAIRDDGIEENLLVISINLIQEMILEFEMWEKEYVIKAHISGFVSYETDNEHLNRILIFKDQDSYKLQGYIDQQFASKMQLGKSYLICDANNSYCKNVVLSCLENFQDSILLTFKFHSNNIVTDYQNIVKINNSRIIDNKKSSSFLKY
jgi:hypothetical protein